MAGGGGGGGEWLAPLAVTGSKRLEIFPSARFGQYH